MKIRIYPKKSDLLQLLEVQLDDRMIEAADAQKALDDLATALIHRPGEEKSAEMKVRMADEIVCQLQDRIFLITSHESPEVRVEIEL